jgi:hypothetical protein
MMKVDKLGVMAAGCLEFLERVASDPRAPPRARASARRAVAAHRKWQERFEKRCDAHRSGAKEPAARHLVCLGCGAATGTPLADGWCVLDHGKGTCPACARTKEQGAP